MLTSRCRWYFLCMAFLRAHQANRRAALTNYGTVKLCIIKTKQLKRLIKFLLLQHFSKSATTRWFSLTGVRSPLCHGKCSTVGCHWVIKTFNINNHIMQVCQQRPKCSESRSLCRKVLKIFNHIWRATAEHSRHRLQPRGEFIDVVVWLSHPIDFCSFFGLGGGGWIRWEDTERVGHSLAAHYW